MHYGQLSRYVNRIVFIHPRYFLAHFVCHQGCLQGCQGILRHLSQVCDLGV